MSFVNELISNEDKNKINFDAIKLPIYNRSVRPYFWTIDRERDIFFMRTLPGNEEQQNIEHFILWWDGEIIPMMLEHLFVNNICVWRINFLSIPDTLLKKRNEIVQIIKDALAAYSIDYGQIRPEQISFEF